MQSWSIPAAPSPSNCVLFCVVSCSIFALECLLGSASNTLDMESKRITSYNMQSVSFIIHTYVDMFETHHLTWDMCHVEVSMSSYTYLTNARYNAIIYVYIHMYIFVGVTQGHVASGGWTKGLPLVDVVLK